MQQAHEVRVVRTDEGHRGECATCSWTSDWRTSAEVAAFLAMRHSDDPRDAGDDG